MCKSIMLHVCCAPCASWCAQKLLSDGYAVTLCFANANLAPPSEYRKRRDATRLLARKMGLSLVEAVDDHSAWLAAVKGAESEPEGGYRCRLCFAYNLRKVADLAQARGFAHIATSLTVSPHKSSRVVFEVGRQIKGFVPINFKKQDGFRKSLNLASEFGLYRQHYCGCEFSFRQQLDQAGERSVPDGRGA